MDFGRRLAKIRADAGYTQGFLAHASGLSQSAISQLESGIRSPTYRTIRQIARALDLPPAYLIGEKLERLTPRESAVLRRYRSLSEPAKLELERLIGLRDVEHVASERRPASDNLRRVRPGKAPVSQPVHRVELDLHAGA
jgi:transcriptional regulator with XRE-family HTH domain